MALPGLSGKHMWDPESFSQGERWVNAHVYKKVRISEFLSSSRPSRKLPSSPNSNNLSSSHYNGLLRHHRRLLHHSWGLITTHQRGEWRIWRQCLLRGCLSVCRSSSNNYHILSSSYVYFLLPRKFLYLSDPLLTSTLSAFTPHIRGFNGFWRGGSFARQQLFGGARYFIDFDFNCKIIFWEGGFDSMENEMALQ